MPKRRREHRNVDEMSDEAIEKIFEDMNLPRTIGQFFVGAMIGFKNNDLRQLTGPYRFWRGEKPVSPTFR